MKWNIYRVVIPMISLCVVFIFLTCRNITVDSEVETPEETENEEIPIEVAGVSLSKNSTTLAVDETELLTATVEPHDAENKSVIWSSNNNYVASVSDNGLITANASGSATIKVSTVNGGFTDVCEVTVVDPIPWWDSSYVYRRPISITSFADSVPSGFSLSCGLDHKVLVDDGKSLADGSDCVVVYWDGIVNTEIDRILDPKTSWDSSDVIIWFSTQETINSNSLDSCYYLYYGNSSASAPLKDENIIFHFADLFERPNADDPGVGWTITESTGNIDILNNTLHFADSGELSNRPVAYHSMSAVTDTCIARIGFNWSRTGMEYNYKVMIHFGESANMDFPPSTAEQWPTGGIGPSLVWWEGNGNMHQMLAYEYNESVTDLATVFGTTEIEIHVNIALKTFDLLVDGVYQATNLAFTTSISQIDAVRFLTSNLNSSNFSGRAIDYIIVFDRLSSPPTITLGSEEMQ